MWEGPVAIGATPTSGVCTPLMAAYWVCSPCLLHERTRSLSCCCPGMLTHYTMRGCAHPVCGMRVLAHCCAAWCCCLDVLTHWMVRVCSPCLPHEHASSAQCSLGVLTPGVCPPLSRLGGLLHLPAWLGMCC